MKKSDELTKPGLYYGVVSILRGNDEHHEFGHGYCQNGAEFIGLLLKRARERNPQGYIINTAYYRMPDAEVISAAGRIKGASK